MVHLSGEYFVGAGVFLHDMTLLYFSSIPRTVRGTEYFYELRWLGLMTKSGDKYAPAPGVPLM